MKYFVFFAFISILASCSPVKKGLLNDQEAFQAIAGKVQTLPEAGAYFSTFDPVALQYAVSANNQ